MAGEIGVVVVVVGVVAIVAIVLGRGSVVRFKDWFLWKTERDGKED